jgi:hypothetical protein
LRDQRVTEAMEVVLSEVAALETLVALDLLFELKVERARHLFSSRPRPAK